MDRKNLPLTREEYNNIRNRCQRLLGTPPSRDRRAALEAEFASLVEKFKACYSAQLTLREQVEKTSTEIIRMDKRIEDLTASLEEMSSQRFKKRKAVRRGRKIRKKAKAPAKDKAKKPKAAVKKKKKKKPVEKKKGLGKKKPKKGKTFRKPTVDQYLVPSDAEKFSDPTVLNEEVYAAVSDYYDRLLSSPSSEQKTKAIETELPILLRRFETCFDMQKEARGLAREVSVKMAEKEKLAKNLAKRIRLAEERRQFRDAILEPEGSDSIEDKEFRKREVGARARKGEQATKKVFVKGKVRRKKAKIKGKKKKARKGKPVMTGTELSWEGSSSTSLESRYVTFGEAPRDEETEAEADEKRERRRRLSSLRKRLDEMITAQPEIVTEAHFMAITQYCEHILDNPDPADKIRRIEAEFPLLLMHFKSCFAMQESMRYKVKEISAQSVMKDQEIEDLLRAVENQKELLGNLEGQLENSRQEVLLAVQEKCQAQRKLKLAETEKEDILHDLQELKRGMHPDSHTSMRIQEEMILERNALLAEVDSLTKKQNRLELENSRLQDELQRSLSDLQSMEQNYVNVRNNWQMEVKNHSRTSKRLMETQKELNRMEKETKSLRKNLEKTSSNLDASLSKLHKAEDDNRKYFNQQIILKFQNERIQKEAQASESKMMVLAMQKTGLEQALADKADEIQNLKNDIAQFGKEKNKDGKRIKVLEVYRSKAERQLEDLRNEKKGIQEKVAELKDLRLQDAEMLLELEKDAGTARDLLGRSERLSRRHTEQIASLEAAKNNLELRLKLAESKYTSSLAQQNRMEKEEKNLLKKINDLTVTVGELRRQITEHQSTIAANEKRVRELKEKAAEEERSMETTREEFSFFKLNYLKAQSACSNLREEVARLNSVIQDFKVDPAGKDDSYKDLELRARTLMRDKMALKRKIQAQTEAVEKARTEASKKATKIQSINEELRPQLARVRLQLGLYQQRNASMVEAVRKKDEEISLLKRKLAVQDKVLRRGDAEYNDRIKDIKLLKKEVAVLARRQAILLKKVEHYGEMKQELIKLQKDLNDEKLRTKALEQELQRPMNVHRWRHLEGSDPDRYHLLTKIHYLQKRLMDSMTKMDKKEHELAESRKTVDEMKQLLKKKPSFDFFNIKSYVNRCKKQKQKTDSLSAQINMYESICANNANEIRQLREQLSKFMNKSRS